MAGVTKMSFLHDVEINQQFMCVFLCRWVISPSPLMMVDGWMRAKNHDFHLQILWWKHVKTLWHFNVGMEKNMFNSLTTRSS
jgi:hypothetical protein